MFYSKLAVKSVSLTSVFVCLFANICAISNKLLVKGKNTKTTETSLTGSLLVLYFVFNGVECVEFSKRHLFIS